MFKFDVRLTGVQQTVDQLNRLQRDLGDKVIVAALNETVKQARTQISRRIRDEYNVDAAIVREKLSIVRATRAGMRFTATLFGNPYGKRQRSLNVIRFLREGATKKATRRAANQLRADLRFRIRKSGGDIAIPGSFILNVPGNPVMERKNGKIVGVRTIGVPSMFQAKKVQQPVHKWIADNFPRIFAREARYYLSTAK